VIPDWVSRSESARATIDCRLDIRYGEGEKQKLDVFSCGDSSAPTLVYFHGGYWQRGDKSIYSFLAEPFVSASVNVVIVGYDLCPSVTLTRISEESRESLAYLFTHADSLGINALNLNVMGHSAGGHITEMMMGTHWSSYQSSLPVELIRSGIPISPLSLLEPVRLTEGLNSGIRMTAEEAESQSPMINHAPTTKAPQMVVVGGAETNEFHRQAEMYRDAFNREERDVSLYVVPDVDHFDELNVLADSGSPFFQKSLALITR